MKKRIWLFLLIFIPTIVSAKNEFNITCDKTDKIDINEQVVCRVSVNSDFLFDNIKYEISDNDNFEIIDIRSNYEKKWDVSNKANIITAKASELQTGLQEFGILLIKAIKSGENSIDISDIDLINSNSGESKKVDDISIKLKVISTNNLLSTILINENEINNFDENTTSYTINIKDDKQIKIEATPSNKFAKVTGTGDFKLSSNVDTFYFPITVISEDNVSKIYCIKLVRNNYIQNNIDKKLDSILIKDDKGNNLIFGFKPDIYEYTIETSLDTKFLDIKPSVNIKSINLVKNYGSQKINLISGNNIVIIKTEDKDGQVLNYVLNIIKPIANKSSNNYIKNLFIKGYKIDFNKKVKNYTLYIKAKDTKLEINPTLENSNAKYIISGNDNLKEGSVIRITVTAENEEKTTYKINIKIKKSHLFSILSSSFIFVILVFIIFKFKNKIIKLFKKLINLIKRIKLPKINFNGLKKLKLPRVNLKFIKKFKITKLNFDKFKIFTKKLLIKIKSIKLSRININKFKNIKLPNNDLKNPKHKRTAKKTIQNNKQNNLRKLNNKKKSPSKKKNKSKKKGKTNYKNKNKK